ncbi:hypothetical protein ES703_80081 [subsurface metagenome]
MTGLKTQDDSPDPLGARALVSLRTEGVAISFPQRVFCNRGERAYTEIATSPALGGLLAIIIVKGAPDATDKYIHLNS